MHKGKTTAVIIPVLDEEETLGNVLRAIPSWVDRVVVVDNGSVDSSARIAREHGVELVREPVRGYGAACLAGIRALTDTDWVIFMDADGCYDPRECGTLLEPISTRKADLVIGVRTALRSEKGAQTCLQALGNRFVCRLIRWRWGHRFNDLGPFRAVRYAVFDTLCMSDQNYGWTLEMQLKAARRGLLLEEVPVTCRRRQGGRSKISGSWVGAGLAGWKMLRLVLMPPRLWVEFSWPRARKSECGQD